MVFENGVLRRIFGSKWEEMVGGWRRLHIEELCNFCTLPYIIRVIKSRRMRWVGHVAHMGDMRSSYSISVGKPDRKRPLRTQRHRWEVLSEWVLQKYIEKVWPGCIWLKIWTKGRLVNIIMNLLVP
jgi:hypothetical protein